MFRSEKSREREAAQQAAQWFARLMAPQAGGSEQAAWQQWMELCPENRRAWTKVEAVHRCFADVPREVAMPTLQGMDGKRRQMLRLAVAGAAAVPLGMLAMQTPQAWRRWNAEFRTAVGEISPLPLRDGAVAVLDTDSAADVVYEEAAHRVLLRNGRVYIKTAPGLGNPLRPLIVQTAYGDVLALESEFVVRVGDGRGQVRVNQNEVRVVPRAGQDAEQRLTAGQWADFSASEVGPVREAESKFFAVWRSGSLVAVNMPLGHFVQRFRAYRPGMLLLDDSLAELPVSGTFPLARSDLALNALENSYPVEIRRLTRYVTWIVPRSEPPRQA
jgi:transmembrane sensor